MTNTDDFWYSSESSPEPEPQDNPKISPDEFYGGLFVLACLLATIGYFIYRWSH